MDWELELANTWPTRIDFKRVWKALAVEQNKKLSVERESNGSRKCKVKCKHCADFQIWSVQSRTSGIWRVVKEKTCLVHGTTKDGVTAPCEGVWKTDPSKLVMPSIPSPVDDDSSLLTAARSISNSNARVTPILASVPAVVFPEAPSIAAISVEHIPPKKRMRAAAASSAAASSAAAAAAAAAAESGAIVLPPSSSAVSSAALLAAAIPSGDAAQIAFDEHSTDAGAEMSNLSRAEYKKQRIECPKCGKTISRNTKHPPQACHNSFLRRNRPRSAKAMAAAQAALAAAQAAQATSQSTVVPQQTIVPSSAASSSADASSSASSATTAAASSSIPDCSVPVSMPAPSRRGAPPGRRGRKAATTTAADTASASSAQDSNATASSSSSATETDINNDAAGILALGAGSTDTSASSFDRIVAYSWVPTSISSFFK